MKLLTEEMKRWFGDGEVDVDLMLRFGLVKEQFIIDLWNREHAKAQPHADAVVEALR